MPLGSEHARQMMRAAAGFHRYAAETASTPINWASRICRRPTKHEIADRVKHLLELVQLEDLADRFPGQLSGGQRQRVALARTLAIEPQRLLLDEPFGALDAKVRVELRRWLRDLHDEMGITTVFVTRDKEEALDLADRVAVMNGGRIEQVGSPRQIYENPGTPFVYEFLGEVNKFDCEIKDGVVRLGNKALSVGRKVPDGLATAYVRPHDTVLRRPSDRSRSDDAVLPGEATVRFVSVLGSRASIELSYNGRLIEAEIPREDLAELELSRGKPCRLQLRLPRIYPKANA